MWQDEIYKIREEHAKSFNYDLEAMFADWQKKQTEGGREVVSLPPKRGLTHVGADVREILVGMQRIPAAAQLSR